MSDNESHAAGTLILADYSTPVEERLIRTWVDANAGLAAPVRLLRLPPSAGASLDFGQLRDLLAAAAPDLRLAPVHVTWLPAAHEGGTRALGVLDLIPGRNPYDPGPRQQAVIVRRDPDRARVAAGTPASVGELRERYAETHDPDHDSSETFTRFTIRRAHLSLERADGRLLGPQFKAARLLKEEILAQPRFRIGLTALAREIGEEKASPEKAEEILDELSTGWGRRAVDVIPRLGRAILERGFNPEIGVLPAELERLRETTRTKPVIFLWSHRSNLDSGVFLVTLHENGFPMPHLFAGINMAFGPMGTLLRRVGFIFIRRSFGDDPLYKFVLREFVGYLSEKRFNLSWSIEGTRSRTGKMLPPKLGLLTYSADAYLQGRTDDVALQPVSITFDQLHEIDEYADYARGGKKAAEGMSWLVKYVKAQGARNYGKVHVRFPPPVSMREMLGPPNGPIAADPAAHRLALQKMAFEVAWRINEAMPVTSTAVVTSLLLASHGAALTSEQVHHGLAPVLDYLEAMNVSRAASVQGLHTLAGVEATLRSLSSGNGPVTRVQGARDVVWMIGQDNQLAATFYRNSLIHVFLVRAIGEIALVLAWHRTEPGPQRVAAFWAAAERLRDLLKFEFYFKERGEFRHQVAQEMGGETENWEQVLGDHEVRLDDLLRARHPLASPFTLRPFFEAYEIVADVLVHQRVDGPVDKAAVTREALKLGEQFLAQQRISSAEPVSALLFDTALQLADNQGILAAGADREERTRAFRGELQQILGAIEEIQRVASVLFVETLHPGRATHRRRHTDTEG